MNNIFKKHGFGFYQCCRTIYDHREIVRHVYNADVLMGFAAGGALVNMLYLKENALVLELPSPDEEFGEALDKESVKSMCDDLALRFKRFDRLPHPTKTGLVLDEGAIRKILTLLDASIAQH